MNHSLSLKMFVPWMGLFLVRGIFIVAGGWGADYGIHWDKDKFIQGIRWAMEHRTLLPQSYSHPSLLHLISMGLLGVQGWAII